MVNTTNPVTQPVLSPALTYWEGEEEGSRSPTADMAKLFYEWCAGMRMGCAVHWAMGEERGREGTLSLSQPRK